MNRHQRRAAAAAARNEDEPIDVKLFVTWATMIAASHPEEERADVFRKMADEHDLCPCCLLRFIVEREMARGHGEDVAPLVNFGERVEIDHGH